MWLADVFFYVFAVLAVASGAMVIMAKNPVHAVLFLILVRVIPMTEEHQRVLMLEAAMPTAVFPIKLAKLYKGDPATAMRAVLSTAVVSLVTIPLWIKFGIRFVGL